MSLGKELVLTEGNSAFIGKDHEREKAKMKYHSATYFCDKCGKNLGTYTNLKNEINETECPDSNWLAVGIQDPYREGLIAGMVHNSTHLCPSCRNKIIDDAKKALYDLGFVNEEDVTDEPLVERTTIGVEEYYKLKEEYDVLMKDFKHLFTMWQMGMRPPID